MHTGELQRDYGLLTTAVEYTRKRHKNTKTWENFCLRKFSQVVWIHIKAARQQCGAKSKMAKDRISEASVQPHMLQAEQAPPSWPRLL